MTSPPMPRLLQPGAAGAPDRQGAGGSGSRAAAGGPRTGPAQGVVEAADPRLRSDAVHEPLRTPLSLRTGGAGVFTQAGRIDGAAVSGTVKGLTILTFHGNLGSA